MSSSKITPEQQRAIQVLLLNLPNWKEFYQPELGASMFPTNFMAFSTEAFHKLPHDDTWIWNQSNAKVTTELDQFHECTLQKMNTRKRKNCPKAPSFKIWLFALNKKNQPSHLYFLWCEKGIPSKCQLQFPDTTMTNNMHMNMNNNMNMNNMHMNNNMNNMNNMSYSSASLSPMSYYSDSKQFNPFENQCNQYYGNNNQNYMGYEQPISIDDLSFLRPFVEQDVAMELGWF